MREEIVGQARAAMDHQQNAAMSGIQV